MTNDAIRAIEHFWNVAELAQYVSFTCCEAETVGYGQAYVHTFSPHDDGASFFLADDPEYSFHGLEDTRGPEALIIEDKRQDWRRTALCLAAAMIESDDLLPKLKTADIGVTE